MTDMAHDLLTEPLIRIRRPQGQSDGKSLAEVLALLAQGEEGIEFRQLQPHQEHAWHAFLVQISAMAMARGGLDDPPTDTEAWRSLLLDLSGGSVEAWHLVVEDLSRPAFLQAPIPEGSLDPLKNASSTPEAIGVLITAKNHDIKGERYQEPAADDWIFALLTLQTMEGFSGRMNYGIARMNGGFGSRPQVAAAFSLDWSERYRHDVKLCLRLRQELLDSEQGFLADGMALLWIPRWDGSKPAQLDELDPLFVEICRRVRLSAGKGGVRVHWGTSQAPRVNAKDRLGNLGDPWTPIRNKDHAALTVSDRGFDYRLLTKLIFSEEFQQAPAQLFDHREPGVPSIVAKVLVRGQGQTGGYHDRVVPLHKKVARIFGMAEGRAQLGSIAESRIEVAKNAELKVLKPAILALHQGAPDKLNFKDSAADPWVAELDAEVDRIFFDQLWADSDKDTTEQLRSWHTKLFELAKEILDRAIERTSHPDARHFKGLVAAERVFYGAAKKHLGSASIFASAARTATISEIEGDKNAA